MSDDKSCRLAVTRGRSIHTHVILHVLPALCTKTIAVEHCVYLCIIIVVPANCPLDHMLVTIVSITNRGHEKVAPSKIFAKNCKIE